MNERAQMTVVRDDRRRSKRETVWRLTNTGQSIARPPATRTSATRERAVLMRATAEARTALEEAVVAATVAAQRARSLANVLEEAAAVLAATETAPTAPTAGAVPPAKTVAQTISLSPREREVLALVAEGRSNKAIAAALFVSPNTVKTHVASLLAKLRAESRAHLAAMAARQGVS